MDNAKIGSGLALRRWKTILGSEMSESGSESIALLRNHNTPITPVDDSLAPAIQSSLFPCRKCLGLTTP